MISRFTYLALVLSLSISWGCDDSSGSNDPEVDQGRQLRDTGTDATGADASRPAEDMMVADSMAPDVAPDSALTPDSTVDAMVPDAGPMLPPVECPEDTAALPESAVGLFGPLMRLNQFNVPSDAAAAQGMGCMVVGRNAGSGLANLLTNFDVDLNAEVQAQPDGRIDTIIFAELNGWQPGQTGNQAREVRLNFLSGDQGPQGEFLVDRDSYVDSDPEGEPQVSFEAATTCERLETQTGEFRLELPVDDLVLGLSIVDSTIAGDIDHSAGHVQ